MEENQYLIIDDNFNVDINTLYDHFYDFRKYGALHPFMKQVTVIEDKTPDYVEYDVCEELRLLGFIKYCPDYKVKVYEKDKYKHIVYTSEVKRGIFLTINLYFTETDGKTYFREKIEVSGNKIIVSVFMKILKNAHEKLYNIIKKDLCRR